MAQRLEDYDFAVLATKEFAGAFETEEFAGEMRVRPMGLFEGRKVFLVKVEHYIQMAETLSILKPKNSWCNRLTRTQLQELLVSCKDEPLRRLYRFLLAREDSPRIKAQELLSPFRLTQAHKFTEDKDVAAIFSPYEKLKMKYSKLLQWVQFRALRDKEVELVALPLREEEAQAWANDKEALFGSEVWSYFKFLGRLNKMLIIPAALGICASLLTWSCGYKVKDSPFDALYGFAVLFLGLHFYSDTEKEEKWDLFTHQLGQSQYWAEVQGQIESSSQTAVRTNRVSGEAERYTPLQTKLARALMTTLQLSPLVVLTVLFLALSMNVRGLIDHDHKLLHIESLAHLTQPGAVFDSTTYWALLPALLHSVVLNLIDERLWRPIARRTSQQELHSSVKDFEKSLILKYSSFQFAITYLDMFYIAFVRLDITMLREQFTYLFLMDALRRVTLETLLPILLQPRPRREESLEAALTLYLARPEYQSFDDYLEVVTNYGYLIMLSISFPLAPLFILGAHYLEQWHDSFKLSRVFRRPLPKVFVGIGFWRNILFAMSFISVLTNIALFAFSSKQIERIFPFLVNQGSKLFRHQFYDTITKFLETETYPNLHDHYQPAAMTLVWVLEHVAFLLFALVLYISSKKPCDAFIIEKRYQLKKQIKLAISKGGSGSSVIQS